MPCATSSTSSGAKSPRETKARRICSDATKAALATRNSVVNMRRHITTDPKPRASLVRGARRQVVPSACRRATFTEALRLTGLISLGICIAVGVGQGIHWVMVP